MFIAHAPSGYLLAVTLIERVRNGRDYSSALMLAAVFGALAPDLDMIYFYLVDQRQTHHHKYFSHWPIVWLALGTASALWACRSAGSIRALSAAAFALGGLVHLVLDSLVGDIWWLAPVIDKPYALFTVAAVFKPWWLNFVLHWSFAAELAICFWALRTSKARRQRPRAVLDPVLDQASIAETQQALAVGNRHVAARDGHQAVVGELLEGARQRRRADVEI